MNCYTSSIIGFGLLGASLYTSISSKEEGEIFKKHLSNEAIIAYDNIVRERSKLYVQGLLIGLFLTIIISFNYEPDNKFHKTTFFMLVILMTGVIYYTLMPKSDYMLDHVKSNDESKAWLEIYKNMKSKYTLGFILASLASVPFAYSFC